MNYPVWEAPAPGLWIAAVAILHVFISHFAVGGGLFLVLAEAKARREEDAALLGYCRRFSRFFVLLTLVLGAATGVGLWFTISIVHPGATSALVQTFLWGWAIEWTFFLAEIASALIYFYGWDRMEPRAHVAVGWIYFATAWLSLAVINGIVSFMLTPGAWIRTRNFWDGLLNPTSLPSLVARTLAAGGLAGIYALFVVSGDRDPAVKRKVARLAGGWILAMAAAGPISLWWYLEAAMTAGTPVGSILGSGGGGPLAAVRKALTLAGETGYPAAQRAFLAAAGASILIVLILTLAVLLRPGRFGRIAAGSLLLSGLLAIGGGEWLREDLRKPFVIGYHMFVNGVRLPEPGNLPDRPPGSPEDPFTIDRLAESGVLAASKWHDLPAEILAGEHPGVEAQERAGREMFKILCSQCHTVDGYNAVRPLVAGRTVAALDGILKRMARMTGPDGGPLPWSDWLERGSRLETWRDRRMPPFAGTEAERRALAVYLARLGGGSPEEITAAAATAAAGARQFDESCSPCHAAESDWPIAERIRGRSAAEFYDLLGRLEEVNEEMEPFSGTEADRRALAEYLESLEP
ncbi:MAG: cytochrome ubiquinol oxidase subunit I [Acidobacteria bacterium]|nr:cytochrome ubiquinol oxidase subunit I [Acidobacteriota bacterium]